MRYRKWIALASLSFYGFTSFSCLPVLAEETQTESSSDEESITMSFDGALLKDVLLLFSQKTGMNFVASSDVEQRKITVYFENVSSKEALDAIMTTNNLSYVRKPGSSIYMVYAKRVEVAELVTKVFKLKFARLSTSPLDIGGQQTVNDLKTMVTAGSSSSSSSTTTGAARGLDTVLRSFLTLQGKMAVDVSTNSIIITDTQETLNQIQKMLVELDVPQQQVILEVHIMEVNKGLVSDRGIEWGGGDGALGSFNGGAATTSFPFDEKGIQSLFGAKKEIQTVEAAETSDLLANQTALSPQMMFGLIDAANFKATLRFISTDSKTKTLARPRILTQNNEAATIRLVANTAIAEITSTTSTAGTANTSSTAERSETGVTLRMTPQINPDNSVTLFLEPSVTTVNNSIFFPNTFLDPSTRVVRTMARVQDNQTLVIGGLIDSSKSFSKRKVPYLGSIPGLGRLFSYEAIDDTDRELLVFITPHLVQGVNSLTQSNVTSKGVDIVAKNMLVEFSDTEADIHLNAFESEQKQLDAVSDASVRREKNAAAQATKKASDPTVEKQMSMALDAFSPQLLDDEISKALSFQSTGRRSQNG